MLIDKINTKIKTLSKFVIPTITDRGQYEANVRNKFVIDYLKVGVEIIKNQQEKIGTEVFVDMIGFYVKPVGNNKFPTGFFERIVYTKEHYFQFCLWYIDLQKSTLIEDLIKNQHYGTSSNLLLNLETQWITECKQNLLDYFSELTIE